MSFSNYGKEIKPQALSSAHITWVRYTCWGGQRWMVYSPHLAGHSFSSAGMWVTSSSWPGLVLWWTSTSHTLVTMTMECPEKWDARSLDFVKVDAVHTNCHEICSSLHALQVPLILQRNSSYTDPDPKQNKLRRQAFADVLTIKQNYSLLIKYMIFSSHFR